ncbi:antitoxin CptB [uncultured Gammaproteobacteria bacterium]
MTESTEVRRRRLRFRAWHRGLREADLMVGGFADQYLEGFTVEQLDRFENLLHENDPDIFDWVFDRLPPPPEHDHDVLALLKTYRYRSPSSDHA